MTCTAGRGRVRGIDAGKQRGWLGCKCARLLSIRPHF